MKITKQQLEKLIDDETFMSRGTEYFYEGMVGISSITKDKVVADSIGTRLYKINLFFGKNGKLDGNCSCPAFQDYGPCKHMAATGLAVIAKNEGEDYEPNEEFSCRKEEFLEIKELLNKKSKEQLIDIILQMADEDPELYYILDGEYDD